MEQRGRTRRGRSSRLGGGLIVLVLGSALVGVTPAYAEKASEPATTTAAARSSAPAQTGPVGWETYRDPARLAELGPGSRARQFSSFDRAGGNDDGFEGTYSCLRETDAGCVLAEHTGAGEVGSIWFTRDGGDVTKTGTITIELDGETVVDAPLQQVVNGELGAPFRHPMVANAEQSSGGVYIKVPMTFRESMRITTEHNPLFYHVTYRQFAEARGISTFDPSDAAKDVLETFDKAGTADPKPPRKGAVTDTEKLAVPAGKTRTVVELDGPAAISELDLTLPELAVGSASSDRILREARLLISFDGQPAVDAPLGEFFGTGLGLHDVRSLMFGVDEREKRLRSWWFMPYAESATIEIENRSPVDISRGTARITHAPEPAWANRLERGTAGHFRSTGHCDEARDGRDHVMLEETGRGRVVGVTHTMEAANPNTRNYLEGDERVFVDGSTSPDLHGTGTEDFYEAGWYFNKGTFNAPLNGNPAHEVEKHGCANDCTGAYRLLLAEAVDFESSIRFGIEHGPRNDEPSTQGSTVYWYAATPNADATGLVWSDGVDVGDPASERDAEYSGGGKVETLRGGFEGLDGPDEPVRLDGRSSGEPIAFTLSVDPDNAGVVLRRTSDQAKAYQSARVVVNGKPAGTWTQPLGTTAKRALDDFYQLPTKLTSGREKLRIELRPTSKAPPWNALSYAALSRVAPVADAGPPTAVTDVRTEVTDRAGVRLNWRPATDDVYAPRYEVHGSLTKGFQPSEDTLLGIARTSGFEHTGLDVRQTWHYRVRAIDRVGHVGKASKEVSATTGDLRRMEAEALLPAADSDAPAIAQGNCCGVTWSADAQLWFQPNQADRHVTVEFSVATAGTYHLTTRQTRAGDYGTTTLALDGDPLGEQLDGYASQVELTEPISLGERRLEAGVHRLTLTVTGKNEKSSGYFAGVDYVDLELAR